MDINDQLQPVVASLLENLKGSLNQQIQDQITQQVVDRIASTELDSAINDIVNRQLLAKISSYDINNISQQQANAIIESVTGQLKQNLLGSATAQITDAVNKQLASVDFTNVLNVVVDNKISSYVANADFPPASIPHSSVDFTGIQLSGDYVKGGIIQNFGSTGIEDRASFVQLTLMDHATAFEGPVYLPELFVKGNIKVEGQVNVEAFDEESNGFAQIVDEASKVMVGRLDTTLFAGYANVIYQQIADNGIDLNRITIGGKEVIKDKQLGYSIIDSNLQKLGLVRDLQTTGENLLCDTLYVTARRVGINTMDPDTALSVWDQEVEIGLGKRSQDTAVIGTPRNQTLIISSNNKDNIKVNTDGSVQIDELTLGKTQMFSSASTPNYEGTRGQIAWNENPVHGAPIGWVCLTGTQWAKFGIIE